MIATDFYSLGLLMLRVAADGRNPFDEFRVIPDNLTGKERLAAMQFMKETDCLHALISDSIPTAPSAITPSLRIVAGLVLADPTKILEPLSQVGASIESASWIIDFLETSADTAILLQSRV